MSDQINPGASATYAALTQVSFTYDQPKAIAGDMLNAGGRLIPPTQEGGSLGAVISPDPRGGCSAYQSENIPRDPADDGGGR